MLLKTTLVAAMGAATLFVSQPAAASTSGGVPWTCYVCYQADQCVQQDVGDAACAQYTSCSTMVGCIGTAGDECLFSHPDDIEILCQ